MQGCSIRRSWSPQSSDAGLRASGRQQLLLSVAFFFLRCGGLRVREPGRDVEGGAWSKKFGNPWAIQINWIELNFEFHFAWPLSEDNLLSGAQIRHRCRKPRSIHAFVTLKLCFIVSECVLLCVTPFMVYFYSSNSTIDVVFEKLPLTLTNVDQQKC